MNDNTKVQGIVTRWRHGYPLLAATPIRPQEEKKNLVTSCLQSQPIEEILSFDCPAHPLREGVCAGSPPGKRQAQANGLEQPGNRTNTNLLKRTLLGNDVGDKLNS